MFKKSKKIYFVANVEFTVINFLLSHIRTLSQHYDLTVICNTDNNAFLKKQGLNIEVIPLKISRNIHLINDVYCLIRLVLIFLKSRPDVVHSISPKSGLLAMIASFVCCVPIRIHTFTGQVWVNLKGFSKKFLKFFDILISTLSTHNIVDSESQRKFLIKEKVLNLNKSIVFGLGSVSGVNLKKFKENKIFFSKVRRRLKIPINSLVFLYLGRLNKDKGVLDLAKCFSRISSKNCFLLVVGPDEGNYVKKIKIINKDKLLNIRFIGLTENPEEYLSASNVLCLPSYREGFGNVIIEAASMGVPSIGSNIYGITDAIIDNKTGLLHKPGDIRAMVNYFERLAKDEKLLKDLGKEAKKRALRDFDSNLLVNYWLDFYKLIL